MPTIPKKKICLDTSTKNERRGTQPTPPQQNLLRNSHCQEKKLSRHLNKIHQKGRMSACCSRKYSDTHKKTNAKKEITLALYSKDERINYTPSRKEISDVSHKHVEAPVNLAPIIIWVNLNFVMSLRTTKWDLCFFCTCIVENSLLIKDI